MTTTVRAAWVGIGCLAALILTACSTAVPQAASAPTPTAEATIVLATPTPPPPPTTVPTPALTATLMPTATPIRQVSPPAVAGGSAQRPASPSNPDAGQSLVVEYGESSRREVALTFDAGADRGYAEEILDLLAAEGITVSFGILGQWAEANPDLVRRMADEGHMLFNHTWSHPSLTGATTGGAPLTYEELVAELERAEEVVAEITGGYRMRPYFRPPYGDYDAASLEYLGRAGYGVTLMWSCDSRDSLGATAEQILARCIDTARPGRIVLLHVGAQSEAYWALPRMIASLRAQGFAFVTAERILQP